MIWGRVCNTIVLALLSMAGEVPRSAGLFELFGFDILLDDRGKVREYCAAVVVYMCDPYSLISTQAWLIEVNQSPALDLDIDLDHHVKKTMLRDLVSLLHLTPDDAIRASTAAPLPREGSTPRRRSASGIARPATSTITTMTTLTAKPSLRAATSTPRGSLPAIQTPAQPHVRLSSLPADPGPVCASRIASSLRRTIAESRPVNALPEGLDGAHEHGSFVRMFPYDHASAHAASMTPPDVRAIIARFKATGDTTLPPLF